MEYKYIVWDWNGTLLDDVGAAMDSVNDMLIKRKMEPISPERYRECISVPIIGFYEKVFVMENENYEELLKEYNEGYLFHLKDCGLSKGADKVLKYFKEQGFIQIIVSSSYQEQLMMNVKKYGVSEYFDAILGSGNYLAGSKIERAQKYLDEHGKGKTLVIGDLVHDFEMAEELSADCVLLSTGHEMRQRLDSSGVKVIDSLEELI